MVENKIYNDYKIVLAGEHDTDLLAILLNSLLQDIHGEDLAMSEQEITNACYNMFGSQHKNAHAFLAYDSLHNAVALMIVSAGSSIYAGGQIGMVTEFVVSPSVRSQGLGEAMVEYAKEFAKEQNWKRIAIMVPGGVGNRGRVMRYFKRNGFKLYGAVMQSDIS